ncbi:hypothetical protein CAEBREN_18888 [Caenorhabditis brenneri]|uniref:MATH domain-containing protein n=1 Tax=Caenorhabditis brenneri TaxID=135651 RepID=G0P314_CAEBE|nr:hypothetical protein CAEBREN_18888 [Caenorhabditis brenneri]
MKADERTYSEEVVHYGIPWSIAIEKTDDHLTILLHCHRSMSSEQKWSVTYQADSKIVLGSKRSAGAHWYTLSNRPENHYSCSSYPNFIKWGEMLKNYVKDGCLNVEVHVSSLKMEGIERKHCISKFKSAKDVRAAIPLDLSRIDRPLLEEMFKKNLTF